MTHAPARLHRRATRPRRPFRRRVELLATLALLAFQLACETPPADEADAGDDVLWVGAVELGRERRGPERTPLLTPIARLDGGVWSNAWPEPVDDPLIEVPVDSAGLVDLRAPTAALPLDLSDPGFPRIAAPARWLNYAVSPPTGRPQHGRVRAVAAEPVPVLVAGLALLPAYCETAWKLRVRDPRGGDHSTETTGGLTEGVSVSQRPDEVLQASDVAGLDEIAARLGFESRTDEDVGTRYEDFSWMGLFRFGSTVLGVVDHRGYEGAGYVVVEIDGEHSRIVADFHRGGC